MHKDEFWWKKIKSRFSRGAFLNKRFQTQLTTRRDILSLLLYDWIFIPNDLKIKRRFDSQFLHFASKRDFFHSSIDFFFPSFLKGPNPGQGVGPILHDKHWLGYPKNTKFGRNRMFQCRAIVLRFKRQNDVHSPHPQLSCPIIVPS